MSLKIMEPYTLSKNEEKTIKENFQSHKDWEKGVFDSIKSNIISDLRNKQNNECCYCRTELGFDMKAVDIEHIIPKSKYPKFTFNTKNLALSCPGCNTNKSSKNVLHKPIILYPRSGANITIIHAHFDDYSTSINIHDGAIFEGRDDKGCETIKLCKLYRLKDVLNKMQKFSSNKSPIQKLVEDIRNADEFEKAQLLTVVKDLITN